MVKELDYAYAVARIRANERYMLTLADIEALISAEDYEKAVSFLASKKWFDCSSTLSLREISENVQNNLWKLLTESVPDKSELEIFTVQNDFFNIKAVLKAAVAGTDCDKYFVYPTSVDASALKEAVAKHQYGKFDVRYNDVLSKAYDVLNKTENGQLAELILDKAALEHMLIRAGKSRSDLLKEIVEFFVAVSNIKIAVKCITAKKGSAFAQRAMTDCRGLDTSKLIKLCDEDLNALAEYLNKTYYKQAAELILKSTVMFEKWCDDTVVELAKKSKYEFFGFAPVCGYYFGKIAEIKTVKAILSAKENGLGADDIRERVRTLYV